MLRGQSVRISQALKSRTGNLLRSRSVSVSGEGAEGGRMTFTHPAYERFLDLRTLHLGGKVVRRRRNIHNRYVFGTYSRIARRVMYGYTEDVAEAIRKELDAESAG